MKLDRWVRLEPGTNRLDFRTDPDLDLNLLVSFSFFLIVTFLRFQAKPYPGFCINFFALLNFWASADVGLYFLATFH